MRLVKHHNNEINEVILDTYEMDNTVDPVDLPDIVKVLKTNDCVIHNCCLSNDEEYQDYFSRMYYSLSQLYAEEPFKKHFINKISMRCRNNIGDFVITFRLGTNEVIVCNGKGPDIGKILREIEAKCHKPDKQGDR